MACLPASTKITRGYGQRAYSRLTKDQDPSTTDKHETAADGEVYTMVDKKPKKKKGKEEKDGVAAMCSMPQTNQTKVVVSSL